MGLLIAFKDTILYWHDYGLLEPWWCEKLNGNLLYRTLVLKGCAAVIILFKKVLVQAIMYRLLQVSGMYLGWQ
jgi:hypothetical protein